MNELLALLGRNWRLLLLYPGGLSTLGALIAFVLASGRRLDRGTGSLPDMPIAALWLLLIALMPLPQTGWAYSLDLLAILLLIELPQWLRLLGRSPTDQIDRAATLLNVYPLLLLAVVAVGQAHGSLVLREINRTPATSLHWIGLAAWAIALVPLLGLGPWRASDRSDPADLIRQMSHMALLLTAALPVNDGTPRIASLIGSFAIVTPLALLDRWWRGDAERWIRWQPWLLAGLGAAIAWWSGQRLIDRLG